MKTRLFLLLIFAGFWTAFAHAQVQQAPQEICVLEVEPKPINIDSLRDAIGYPEEARSLGIDGQVLLRMKMDRQGLYLEHQVLNDPHPLLTEAVTHNIHLLRFVPGMQAGKPIPCWVTIPFNFKLNPDYLPPRRQETVFMSLREALACPKIENVRHLNLMAMDLETFPMEILKFKYLVSLELEMNRLTEIPATMLDLEQLHFLDLGFNALTHLPEGIWKLRYLEILGIQGNAFSPQYRKELEASPAAQLFPRGRDGKVKW
jgi:TonB family protein